jgi:hypothetical protein
VNETKKDLSEIGLISTIVRHAGDGEFDAMILFTTDEEMKTAKDAVHRMWRGRSGWIELVSAVSFPSLFTSTYIL